MFSFRKPPLQREIIFVYVNCDQNILADTGPRTFFRKSAMTLFSVSMLTIFAAAPRKTRPYMSNGRRPRRRHELEFCDWKCFGRDERPDLVVPFKRATYEVPLSAFGHKQPGRSPAGRWIKTP